MIDEDRLKMNLYKIKVTDLPPEGAELFIDLPAETAEQLLTETTGDTIALDGPLVGRVLVEPSGDRVVVTGKIGAMIKSECARCLIEIDLPISEEILVVYTPRSKGPGEVDEDSGDDSEEFFTGEEIDLWPMLAEHLLLGLPIRALCHEECPGLCPRCGENLNAGPCRCQPDSGHPGLAVLKNLLDKNPGR
ncbi:MAG: DUF177 domain-containing protein [Deltaproteobacteria bacterium]|nr:DUF177 domain-containing protein [Deltaproteobacteria bacterium]